MASTFRREPRPSRLEHKRTRRRDHLRFAVLGRGGHLLRHALWYVHQNLCRYFERPSRVNNLHRDAVGVRGLRRQGSDQGHDARRGAGHLVQVERGRDCSVASAIPRLEKIKSPSTLPVEVYKQNQPHKSLRNVGRQQQLGDTWSVVLAGGRSVPRGLLQVPDNHQLHVPSTSSRSCPRGSRTGCMSRPSSSTKASRRCR